MSYEEFGRAFIELVVTPERVAAAVAAVAGDRVEVGPLRAGPGEAASVKAAGSIRAPEVRVRGEEPRRFDATIPVSLDLNVRLPAGNHRFTADVTVPLALTVLTAPPLDIVIDIADVQPKDVEVDLQTRGLRGRILRSVGDMDNEVRRHVARVVGERLDSDAARSARVIPILSLVDRAWSPPEAA